MTVFCLPGRFAWTADVAMACIIPQCSQGSAVLHQYETAHCLCVLYRILVQGPPVLGNQWGTATWWHCCMCGLLLGIMALLPGLNIFASDNLVQQGWCIMCMKLEVRGQVGKNASSTTRHAQALQHKKPVISCQGLATLWQLSVLFPYSI